MTPDRRGSVYIIVLVTAAIVAAIGITGLQLQRIHARSADLDVRTGEARLAAIAGVRLSAEIMNASTDWRAVAARTQNLLTNMTVGRTEIGVTVSDEADGNLEDDAGEPVRVSVVALNGSCRQYASATATPVWTPLDSLSYALTAGSGLVVASGSLRSDGEVFAVGSCVASSATVNAHVRASGSISGTTYSRSVMAGLTPPALPDSTLLTSWASRGTAIPYGALTQNTLRGGVLCASSNPFGGGVNADGIYVISCGSADLLIESCRVRGTLIVLNAGVVTIGEGVVLDAPAPGAPALLVEGELKFASSAANVQESTIGFNLNPACAPWKGESDSDTVDALPCGLYGLVYAVKGVQVPASSNVSIDGVLITAGLVEVQGVLSIAYDATIFQNPPDGFRTGPTWEVQEGTWAQGTE